MNSHLSQGYSTPSYLLRSLTVVESDHKRVRYPCYKCEYVANILQVLKRHIKSKHEGKRYPCAKWEYSATRQSYLKEQIKNKHVGSL